MARGGKMTSHFKKIWIKVRTIDIVYTIYVLKFFLYFRLLPLWVTGEVSRLVKIEISRLKRLADE